MTRGKRKNWKLKDDKGIDESNGGKVLTEGENRAEVSKHIRLQALKE